MSDQQESNQAQDMLADGTMIMLQKLSGKWHAVLRDEHKTVAVEGATIINCISKLAKQHMRDCGLTATGRKKNTGKKKRKRHGEKFRFN